VQFIATGTYSNGKQVTPIPVSWVNAGLPIAVTTQPPYSLSSSPFVVVCLATGVTPAVAAMAPANPRAPNRGSVPVGVWQYLVFGNTQNEGGFVGATAQLTCS